MCARPAAICQNQGENPPPVGAIGAAGRDLLSVCNAIEIATGYADRSYGRNTTQGRAPTCLETALLICVICVIGGNFLLSHNTNFHPYNNRSLTLSRMPHARIASQ